MPEEVCVQAPDFAPLRRTGEKWGCQLSTTPSRDPVSAKKGEN